MTKSMGDIVFLSIVFIIFCQNFAQVNALRCAHSCAVGPVSFGTSDPIRNPCNTVDINTTTTVCTVILNVNFRTSFIRGTLTDKPRTGDQQSALHLSFTLNPSVTMISITYECATTNDCDQDFVRETISSTKWVQLNETKLRTDITALIFRTDASVDSINCANDIVCASTENCFAQLTQNSSISQTGSIDLNNKLPCDNTFPSTVAYDQYFNAPSGNRYVTMDIHCGKNGCNEQQPIEKVYNIFQNDFILPLNYSAYTPKDNGSYRINYSINILIFFIC